MAYNDNLSGYYSEIRRLLTEDVGETPGVFNDTPEGHLYEAVRVMGGSPAALNPTRLSYLRALVALVRDFVGGTTGAYTETEAGYAYELNRLLGGGTSDNLLGWLANAVAALAQGVGVNVWRFADNSVVRREGGGVWLRF